MQYEFTADSNASRKSNVSESGDTEIAEKPAKVSKASKGEKAKSSLEQLPSNAVVGNVTLKYLKRLQLTSIECRFHD
jgi:hypothetical protein